MESGPLRVKVADYSSFGPTRDNRDKPDIAAPGGAIRALCFLDAVGTPEESPALRRHSVTYRCTESDHPTPLVLPQACIRVRVIRMPTQPETIGDHVRLKRLARKMQEKEVAEQIGVDKTSVFNWEAGISTPDIRYIPAVIQFLGYNPLPAATTICEQLVRQRTTIGLSQKEAAAEIGVDPGTLARWERGEREPNGAHLEAAE